MEKLQITTSSENTVKAYEFLKANPDQMFTIKDIAEALGVTSAQILGGLTSLNKKGAVDKHDVEVDGKALKAYSASGLAIEFVAKEPAKMSDKAIRVLEYLKNGGSGQTHAEIAEALGVSPVAGIVGVVNSLVKKNLAEREEVEVEVGEGEVKKLKIVKITEDGMRFEY
jgi:DNA-binding MarR family transcriptional regulator